MRNKLANDIEEYFTSDRFTKTSAGILIPDTPEGDLIRWGILTDEEKTVIWDEIQRIRDSFEYTAENWFWIAEKGGKETLFNLWDGQILVIEKLKDMYARNKPQWIVVVKSRQLGLSQLGCALGAWKCFFQSNQRGLIMSENDDKTINIWNNYLSPIYRRLPWFLKPQYSSFTLDKGIILDTDPKKTNMPGLRSSITVTPASTTGHGIQGVRLNFFHGSEYASWPVFTDLIERGAENALYRHKETIALLESTPKGANTPTHAFWNKQVGLGDKADWEPVFLPCFTDRTHVSAPWKGWRPTETDIKRRDVVKINWVKCDNRTCKRYFDRNWNGKDQVGSKCRFCKIGTCQEFTISDEQLFWIYEREFKATDKNLVKQEQSVTAEEAFIISGNQVFSEQAISFAEHCAEKSKRTVPFKGFINEYGFFHGTKTGHVNEEGRKQCFTETCTTSHETAEDSITIWETPVEGGDYYIGVDGGEGKGKDYTTAIVIKKGRNGNQDRQVAVFRDNTTNPYDVADKIKRLANFYKDAHLIIEYMGPGRTIADKVYNTLGYWNVYRRRGQDYSKNISGSLHFLTNVKTKEDIIKLFERWLSCEAFVVRDTILASEIKTYVIDEDGSKNADSSIKAHDDYVVAAMLAIHAAHLDDRDLDGAIKPTIIDPTPANQPYIMECAKCGNKVGVYSADTYPSDSNGHKKCLIESCHSLLLRLVRNDIIDHKPAQDRVNYMTGYRSVIVNADDIFKEVDTNSGPDYLPYF